VTLWLLAPGQPPVWELRPSSLAGLLVGVLVRSRPGPIRPRRSGSSALTPRQAKPITRGDRYRTQRARPLSSAMVVLAGDQRARSASARR
jgi:hypothetical protein